MAVLDLPKRINVLITYASGVVVGMTGNPSFPTPSPALATVTAAIADLPAGHRSSYDWQSSPDGKTWTDLGTTLQAKTTLTGQTAGTVLQLRYRPVTRTGAGDWSTPVTFTVK